MEELRRAILMACLGLLLAGGASGVEPLGSGAVNANFNISSLSGFNVPSGTDRLLVVAVMTIGNPSAVSYGATPLTEVITQSDGSITGELWVVALGSGGAMTANITTSGFNTSNSWNVVAAQAFQNADQADPIFTETSAPATGTSSALSIASAPGDLVFDALMAQGTGAAMTAVADADQTERFNDTNGNALGAGSTEPGAASVTVSWDYTSFFDGVHLAMSIRDRNRRVEVLGSGAVNANFNISSLTSFNVPSGRDRVLIVAVMTIGDPSAVSYGGTPLTEVITQNDGSITGELWIVALGSGDAMTANITTSGFNTSNSWNVVGAQAFQNVDQTDPIFAATSLAATGTSSVESIASAAGDMVFDALMAQGTGAAMTAMADADQTERFNDTNGNALGAGSTEPGAASVTVSWDYTSFFDGVHLIVALRGVTPRVEALGAGAVNADFNVSGLTSFTVPEGSNRLLIVALQTANANPSAVSFGVTALSELVGHDAGSSIRGELWFARLGSAAETVANITTTGMNTSNSWNVVAAQAFQNVDQDDPLSNWTSTTAPGTAGLSELSVSSRVRDLVFDAILAQGNGSTMFAADGASQTVSFNDTNGNALGAGSTEPGEGEESVAMSWLYNNFLSGAHLAVNIQAGGPGRFGYDVDANGAVGPLTDGLLILRYLFGFTGSALVGGALGDGATRTDAEEIVTYLELVGDGILDPDGNDSESGLTDGLLILRFLFGFTGDALINGAIGAGATRTTAEAVSGYMSDFVP